MKATKNTKNAICKHIKNEKLFIQINNSSDSQELEQLIRLAYPSKDEFENAIKQLKRSIKNSDDYDIDIISYHVEVNYYSNNTLFLNALKEDHNVDFNYDDENLNQNNNKFNYDLNIDDDSKNTLLLTKLPALLISKSFVFRSVELFVKVALNFENLTKHIKIYEYHNKYGAIISNQKSRAENIFALKIHEIVKEAIHNHLLSCADAVSFIKQNNSISTLKNVKQQEVKI